MKKLNTVCVIGLAVLSSFILAGCLHDQDAELELMELSETAESGYYESGSAEDGNKDNNVIQAEAVGASGSSKGLEAQDTVTVYVCGQVKNAGVYELSEGARIVDALIAAGGLTKEAAAYYLNQAELLSDGGMIYVPSNEELEASDVGQSGAAGTVSGGAEGSGVQGGLVNINAADKAGLMTITGVGEAKAEKIIAYREQYGRFQAIEDIMNVPGIKEGMFLKIKDQICVK